LAEAASEVALSRASLKPNAVSTQLAVGQMETALTTAQLAWQDMVARAGNCDFTPSPEHANAQLVRKTIVTRAVQETVARAVEVAGGAGYYRNLPLERMWRDVQASHYHPLPEKRQQLFTGRHRLGLRGWRPSRWRPPATVSSSPLGDVARVRSIARGAVKAFA
jgi:acyl-CoA dehydrogenase